jgi:hypothetical protein
MAKNRNPAAGGDGGSEADHPGRAIGAELAQSPIRNQDAPPLAEHAAAIRALGKRVVGDVIEIGRRLADCKARVGHGGWLPWLHREFGWDERTAQRYVSIHEMAGKYDNLSDLNVPVSSLYLLAAPSTPDEARATVIERAETGESMPVEEVKRTIKEARQSEADQAEGVPAKARPKTSTGARSGTARPRSMRSCSRKQSRDVPLDSLAYSNVPATRRTDFILAIGYEAWWGDAPKEFREKARSADNTIRVDVQQVPSEVRTLKLSTPPAPVSEEDRAADDPMAIPAALRRMPTDRFGRPRPEPDSLPKSGKKRGSQ